MEFYRGYKIETLKSFVTPYWYAAYPESYPELYYKGRIGPANHFMRIAQLRRHVDRMIKDGKLPDLGFTGEIA